MRILSRIGELFTISLQNPLSMALVEGRGDEIHDNIEVLKQVYRRNIFPAMKIGWGTYEDHIGHTDFPGCFRCYDGNHQDASGETITDDCDTCHNLLAMEEENPEVLFNLMPD